MDQLRAMRVFVQVAEGGSFAAAARTLDLAPAVVTRLVAELEEHLGARLMHRTTRRLALTEAGEDYLARARQILADVDAADAAAGAATAEPRGHVRLLAPPSLATHQLAKHLPEFHRRHPHITLQIDTPGPVDTIDEAYDLTLIISRAPLDGDFVARRLARTEVILCAAPDYLNRRGRPVEPEDLVRHDTMLPPISELQRGIPFLRGAGTGPDELRSVVPPRPLLTTQHVDTMYAAALHGLGISGLPSYMIEDALLEQALERVLPAWRLFSLTLWAALPSRKHLPARTRVLLDFLLQVFGGADRDPWLAAAGCESRPWPEAAAGPAVGGQRSA